MTDGRQKTGGRRFAAGLALGLAACTQVPQSPEAAAGPVIYPDLHDVPAHPGLPPTEAEREATVAGLEAAHAANASAAENLNREIENDFEIPAPSGN
jgi:hypothetical protein